MSSHEEVVISGVGLVTSVGHDARAVTAAVHAGVARLNVIPEFTTDDGAGAAGGWVAGLTDGRSGCDRLLTIAVPALQEALDHAEGFCADLPIGEGSLLLALAPEDRPAYEAFEDADLAALLEGAECPAFRETVLLRGGHASGIEAMGSAVRRVRDGRAQCCVVGGMDSLVDYPSLIWYDQADRLRTDARGYGFVPGEGAAFLVVETTASARKRGATPLARIDGVGLGREPAPLTKLEPSRAAGLVDAIRAAVAATGAPAKPSAVLCDLNGENYRMREWAVARTRALPAFDPEPALWHPAECHGDLGAASAVSLIALATTAMRDAYLGVDRALVWCSSDAGGRGALLLRGIA